jgi:hypothetical protein
VCLFRGAIPGTQQLQGVDANIANWAFTQAAASLGPALSQLAAANIQQAQQAQLQAQLLQSQQHAQQAKQQQAQHQQAQQQQAQLQAQQQQAQLQAQQQQAQLQAQQQKAQLQAQQQAQLQAQQQAQLHTQLQAQQPLAHLLSHQTLQLQAHIQEQQAKVELQLRQLTQQAQEVSAPAPPTPTAQGQQMSSEEQAKAFAIELKQAYDRHVKSLGFQTTESDGTSNSQNPTFQGDASTKQVERAPCPSGSSTNTQAGSRLPEPRIQSVEKPRTDEDKEGGTALLGFLTSLRQSYEDVLREKQGLDSDSIQNMFGFTSSRASGKSESSYDPITNRTVTDSSSQQRDSSVEDSEDWNSDKKTDPSSSEDSDKEVNERGNKNKKHSKGPLRKRMKMTKVADEIRKGPTS